jgi:hypothetical protein
MLDKHETCKRECITCHRDTCSQVSFVPGDEPEEAKPTTSRVEDLEIALQECKTKIEEHAHDTCWYNSAETLCEYIDRVLADDDQGELFTKPKLLTPDPEQMEAALRKCRKITCNMNCTGKVLEIVDTIDEVIKTWEDGEMLEEI